MDSNSTNLGYVEEVTFGTTPTAALQILRRTGGSFTPSQNTIVSDEIRADLRAGKPVRTSQMANGSFPVEWSYGTLDDMLEGMLMEAWATDVLVDGTTKKAYTFEEQFVDPALTAQYMIYKGCRIASLNMSFALDQIVSGSLGIMAATPSIAQASAGTGNTAATTSSPWNTVDFITGLTEGAVGAPAALTRVTGVDIQLDRSLREKREFSSLNPYEIGVGRLMVTGTIQQYFENTTLIDAYFAFEDRELNVTITDDDGDAMLIEIPKIKYTGDLDVGNPGPDGDVSVSVPFTAHAAAGDAALISFTRTPAV